MKAADDTDSNTNATGTGKEELVKGADVVQQAGEKPLKEALLSEDVREILFAVATTEFKHLVYD